MSVQPIESGSTLGLQVRIFRRGEVAATRFLAYKKHGGKRKTLALAKEIERNLEVQAGPLSEARRRGDHASKANRNSSTGISGIMAWYLNRQGRSRILQIAATWSPYPGSFKCERTQFSALSYGVMGASRNALKGRREATGQKMPSARAAWEQIRDGLGLPEDMDPEEAVFLPSCISKR